MTQEVLERARRAVRALCGQTCKAAYAGQGDLTTLYLAFGNIVQTIKNPLPQARKKELRIYEFSIRTSSAWRLDGQDRVLCSFDDEKPLGGEVRRLLSELEGQKVSSVEMAGPAGDLDIRFEKGQVVRVFCCAREGACGGDYYFIGRGPGAEESFQVGPRGAIDFDWPHSATPAPTGETGEPGD